MSCVKSDAISALNVDAKAYPGGIPALAKRVGRSPGVLYNKFSEADERYEVTDREADAMALEIRTALGSTAYIEAKCAGHGGVFVPLPDAGEAADDDVLTALLESMRALGDMARELTEARADGLITLDEFDAYALKARRAIARIHHSVQTVRTQVCGVPQVPASSFRSA